MSQWQALKQHPDLRVKPCSAGWQMMLVSWLCSLHLHPVHSAGFLLGALQFTESFLCLGCLSDSRGAGWWTNNPGSDVVPNIRLKLVREHPIFVNNSLGLTYPFCWGSQEQRVPGTHSGRLPVFNVGFLPSSVFFFCFHAFRSHFPNNLLSWLVFIVNVNRIYSNLSQRIASVGLALDQLCDHLSWCMVDLEGPTGGITNP